MQSLHSLRNLRTTRASLKVVTNLKLVFFAIVCALLVFMVIIQDQEGEGLGGMFGGASNAAFGSRSTNVVVKFTYVLGGLFFVLAFSLAVMNRSQLGDVETTEILQNEAAADGWFTEDRATELLDGVVPALNETEDSSLLQPPASDD